MLRSLWQDVRYTLRLQAKSPGFTLTALMSLALGIGATTAVFSVIHGVLLSPYPYAGADRMVRVLAVDRSSVPRNFFLTGPQLEEVRRLNSVESALGQANWEISTTGGDLPEDVRVVFLTVNASSFFSIPSLLGRGLIPSDALEGQDPQPVAVLSHSFWRRRFAGDHGVVGKILSIGHKDYTIVGVLPARFAWTMADVYVPLKVTNDPNALIWLSCVKLKAGVTPQTAEAELGPLLENFAKENPHNFPDQFHLHIRPLTDERDFTFVHMLYLLFAAVALMLWIGCANFSILLLTRGAVRQQELAIRAAMGASRTRLVRQLLIESLLLAFGGATLGVWVAYIAIDQIVKWLPRAAYPPEMVVKISLPVLAFAVGLAVIVGVLFGLSPSVRLSRAGASRALLAGGRAVGGPIRASRVHACLVAVQVALTLVLLSAGSAAAEGFLSLLRMPLGYDPRNTMVVGIPLRDNTYMSFPGRASFFAQLREKTAGIPGVLAAAISTRATPPDSGLDTRVSLTPAAAPDEIEHTRLGMVSPEYFSLLRIPVLSGRIWDQAETMRAAPVAVINETMARHWPNGNPVGQSLRLLDLKSGPFRVVASTAAQPLEIIGVVADTRNDGLRQPVKPAAYVPYTMDMEVFTTILVHANGSLAATYKAIRKQVRTIDADQQVEGHGEILSLESLVTRQQEWQRGHLATILLGVFALLALALAGIGLYSVVSYGVARRTNEFGIRIALGAQRRDVMKLVFGSTSLSVGIGLAMGLFLSFTAEKLVVRWTEVSTTNPLVLLSAVLLFLAAASVACILPARRASSIDPMESLRRE